MILGFGRARPPLLVRLADMADAGAMARIHAAAFERSWGRMEFERLLAEETVLAHVAAPGREGDDPQGFVVSRRAADEAEILSIAVAPERRGKGVAGRLMDAHQEMLRLSRVRTLFLEVEEANAPALALYRRRGFREVGRRTAYYRKADGGAATAVVMRAAL